MTYRLILGNKPINHILNQIRTNVKPDEIHIDMSGEFTTDSHKASIINTTSASDLIQVLKTFPEQITSISIRSNALSRYTVDELKQIFLALNKKLTSIDLQGNGFNELAAEDLVTILKKLPPNLSFLGLQGNYLGKFSPLELTAIIRALPKNLVTLNLCGNALHYIPANRLVKVFKELPPTLKSLDLSGFNLLDYSVDELIKIMSALPKNINSLDLSLNDLNKLPPISLAKILNHLPLNIISVCVNSESIDPKIIIIENEINRLMNYHSSKAGLMVALGLMEVSDRKIMALNELKNILIQRNGKTPEILNEELLQWHETNDKCIKLQRNKVHAFFAPHHKTSTQEMIEELLTPMLNINSNAQEFKFG